ncbi:MAG: hypothetical protein WAW17_01340 [Rhodococcus sp. (in: high G+C Gram-positive bacteria)]|uniref:hypothetical protein n=1 Tax=Rhodococcus sp. TaxID=1831 RepID=UPI003BAEFB26
MIAELYADLATGQIMNVWTKETRRGEGLARKVHEAAEATVELFHSPDEHCTPQGFAFKQAMGGVTIEDTDAYDPEA